MINKFKTAFTILKRDGTSILANRIISELKNIELFRLKRSVKSIECLHYMETGLPTPRKQDENIIVTIVIVARNGWSHTVSCMASIIINTINISYEIILIDNSSKDHTRNIENTAQNITVIRNENNESFFNCFNNAVQHAKGKYIVFLNNHVNVQKDWLYNLYTTIESDENIGMVGPKVITEKGKLADCGTIIWKDGTMLKYGWHDDPLKPEYCYKRDVDSLSHYTFMIKKDLLMKIEEDNVINDSFQCNVCDLAFIVRKKGQRVVFQPKSIVLLNEKNLGRKNSKKLLLSKKTQHDFYNKWKNELCLNHLERNHGTFQARDRSASKKTIVIIDTIIPTFDQDAGSRMMYQYITMFLDFGFNVKFIPYNLHKLEPYASELENKGMEILYGNHYLDNDRKNLKKWLTKNSSYFDYIYLNRPDVSYPLIDHIKKSCKAKILYNGVDFHFVRLEREFDVSKDITILNEAKKYREMEMHLFQSSDVVLTVSEFEKNLLNQLMPDKKVYAYPIFSYKDSFPLGNINKSKDYHSRNSLTFVGGFNHRPNIDGILWFVKEIFPGILKKNPDIKLNIIGSFPPEDVTALQSSNVNVTGFISDDELEWYYSTTRVVIAPLRFGAGVKGKVIEAIVHGLPIVTTTVGKEGINDADGFIYSADTVNEFCDKVLAIYNDKKEWDRIRKKEIEYSWKYLSYNNAVDIFKQILEL